MAAAAVLALGGSIAEPYVQDWMLVREACSGSLPADAVRQPASRRTTSRTPSRARSGNSGTAPAV
ncbi:hypothetical protein ABT232_23060 [Streptomyces sp. NPDC001532]|uniref:hypothetical protein n=1 Tax=Streptomyces sp. NPDC001532 TaxID=3154520 RepID=UPI00331D5C75